MNLLAATLYDPAVAVTKNTTAAIAMTALDTTNLRLTFTVPPSGRVWVRIKGGALHGAVTYPMMLVGVLEGATVKARVVPQGGLRGTAVNSTQVCVEAEFPVVGLTPGASLTWDVAYGCEVLVAATGWKYGGPNNTTANDAFGGISFEIWDPSPSYTPAVNNVPPTTTLHQKIDTVDGVVDAILVDTDVIGATGQGLTSLATQASVNTVDTVVDAIKLKTDNLPADPADASDVLAAIAAVEDFVDTEVGAIKLVTDKLDTALELDGAVYRFTTNALEQGPAGGAGGLTAADVWAHGARTLTSNPGLDAAGIRTAVGLATANLDTQLDAIPTAAEITAHIDANSADLDAIGGLVATIAGRTDVATSTRLAAADYAEPDNAGIAAIQAKTDGLTFTSPGKLDVQVLVVNGVTLAGSGTPADPMRPA